MFVKTKKPEIGDWVVTTRELESCAGKFEAGSKVKIISVGDRGYEIVDELGNTMCEIGWVI